MSEQYGATAVIADDHALLRSGMCQIIEAVGNIEVVAEAVDGLEAISLSRKHNPTILTLDIAMPYAQGMEIYTEVRRWSPDTRIVVFTGLTSVGLLSELVSAGVDGLFLKSGDPGKIGEAFPLILAGGKVVGAEVLELLEQRQNVSVLTARERQILSLVATGTSNREIGDRLGLSPKTVDNHRTNIMRKLEVHSVAELLNYALREGLLDAAKQL